MKICCLGCDAVLISTIESFHLFEGATFLQIDMPLTDFVEPVDFMIVGPLKDGVLSIAETISDWAFPPIVLFVVQSESYDLEVASYQYHPRVGRCCHFCKNEDASIQAGLEACYSFYLKRNELIDSTRDKQSYILNNVSPRWLFHSLMDTLDEFISFKNGDGRFLAVSRYMLEQASKGNALDLLDLTNLEYLNALQVDFASEDECRIRSGQLLEIQKEEQIVLNQYEVWMLSRTLPLMAKSQRIAGTFNISRDITAEKKIRQSLLYSNELMEADLRLAQQLQEIMLKNSHGQLAGPRATSNQLKFSAKYIPSFHVSGDFYSIVEISQRGVGFFVADVMGHGVRSAMVTAMMQIAIQQLNAYASEPAIYMAHLNSMLYKSINQIQHTLFATAIYCFVDLVDNHIQYVQAGGRHGVICSKSKCVSLTGSVGPALGLLPHSVYSDQSIPMKAGDRILLFTDGLSEASGVGSNSLDFGERGVRASMRKHKDCSLDQMLDGILADVIHYHGDKVVEDDLCLISFELIEGNLRAAQ